MVNKTHSLTFNLFRRCDYSHFIDEETEAQKHSVTLFNFTRIVSGKVAILIHCSLLFTRAAVPESVLTGYSSTFSMYFLSIKPIKGFVLILLTIFKVIKLLLGENIKIFNKSFRNSQTLEMWKSH